MRQISEQRGKMMFSTATTRRIDRAGSAIRKVPTLGAAVVGAMLLGITASPTLAQQVDATWVGGTGNWNVALNWFPQVVPNNNGITYNVLIDNGNPGTSAVSLDMSPTIDNLAIDTGESLSFNNGQLLTVMGGAGAGSISNSGDIALNSTGSYTYLRVNGGDVTLDGGGTVTLSDHSSLRNQIYGAAGTDRLINGDNTISGSGKIGANAMALTNQGVIDANVTNSLTVDPSASGVINSGTMRATNGATLILYGGDFTNFEGETDGLIRADNSMVQVASSTVTGGIVDVVGTGEIQLSTSTVTGGTLSNSGSGFIRTTGGNSTIGGTVTNPVGGQVILNNNTTLTLESTGTYTNGGDITLDSTGSYTYLRVSGGDVTLDGGGTVTLSDHSSLRNRIYGAAGTDRLINEDNTIQGAGQIGVNLMGLTNQSLIVANVTNPLTVDPSASGAINSGTMRATNGATLILYGGDFTNFEGETDGLIRADNSMVQVASSTVTGGIVDVVGTGEIQLSTSTVTGGALSNSGSGFIRTTGGTSTIGGTVTNPVGGQVILNNNTTLTLESTGTYTNGGDIALNSTGSYTYLRVSGGDVTLDGGGTVTLSDHSSLRNQIYGAAGTDRLINEDNTIQGAGQIGVNLMGLTNQSLIVANVTNPLTIDPSAEGAINTGTLRADSAGVLKLSGGTFDNTGGTIEALDASRVELNIVTVEGGTLSTTDSGLIHVTGTTTLDGSTETVANVGAFEMNVGQTTIIEGTLTNSGDIALNSTGGAWTYLRVSGGDVMLDGGGTVTLSDDSYLRNQIYGAAGTDRLINVDNTISGSGKIGANAMALTNQGVIDANVTNSLTVDPSTSGAINSGTMRATNDGALILYGGDFTNFEGETDGLIRADNSMVQVASSTVTGGNVDVVGTGEIQLSTSTITGGALSNSGSGFIRTTGGTSTIGGTVTNPVGGQVILDNGTYLTLESTGTYTNGGDIALDSTGSYTNLLVSGGDVTLGGGGTVTLSDHSSLRNRIYGVAGTDRLINVDNTIQGAGQIGVNLMGLTNQSLIVANVTNPLTIDPSAEGAINTGTLRADSAGVLKLYDGTFTNTGGTIEALDASLVELNSVTIEGGTLSTTDSGLIQVTGTTTLDGSTETVANVGAFEMNVGQTTIIEGTLTNSGNIAMNSTGGAWTYLRVSGGDVTLDGGGTVTLSDDSYLRNQIYGTVGTDRLINVDNTISGSGKIGANVMGLTNQSLIVANGVNSLTIDPSAEGVINTGTLRADSAGVLKLYDGTFTNTGGTIEALDASLVELNSVTVEGGTLSTTDSGVIHVTGTTTLDGSTETVANVGAFEMNVGQTTIIEGTLTNSGDIAMNSTGGAWTYLRVSGGDVTLDGGGTVTLSDDSYLRNQIYGTVGTDRLINVDNTISGSGIVGANAMSLTNQGSIIADGAYSLTIDPAAGGEFRNENILQATGEGGLVLAADPFTTSGQVSVALGSSISRTGDYTQTAGSTTVDGVLSATGIVDIQGGILSGSGTVMDDVVNAGSVQPGNSAGTLTIDTDYAQDGSGEVFIEIGGLVPGDDYDVLAITGNADLDGALRVEFIGGFDPVVGNSFTVMTFASRTGTFANLDVPCLPDGELVQVSISDTNVIVSISEAVQGDMNCDCAISMLDVEAFVLALIDPTEYAATYTGCNILNGDFTGDFEVDGEDIQGFVDAFIP